MGTDKRARQKAGRQARLAEAQAAAARRKRTRSGLLLAGLVVVLVAVTLVVGGLGSDDGEETVGAEGGSTTTTIADGSTPSTIAVTIPPAGATIDGATPCPPADGSAERTTTFAEPPPTCIDPARTYTATVTTTHGEFAFTLDTANAPITANNFVVLARYHYYDGVSFHRIIPQFMIQGGDAVGPSPGSGGPGYSIADELPSAETTDAYVPGAVAMANSGPNTSGSQFFVMATGSTGLSNDYSVFGHIVSGQDVVDAINLLGDAASNGTPTEEVVMTSVTITEA